MLLGRVIGQVVLCVVTPGLEGVPMLIVQPLDKRLAPKGKAIVAADVGPRTGPMACRITPRTGSRMFASN